MAVLIASKVKGQTVEGYDGVFHAVKDLLSAGDSFIIHFAHPVEGEWNVYKVW